MKPHIYCIAGTWICYSKQPLWGAIGDTPKTSYEAWMRTALQLWLPVDASV